MMTVGELKKRLEDFDDSYTIKVGIAGPHIDKFYDLVSDDIAVITTEERQWIIIFPVDSGGLL